MRQTMSVLAGVMLLAGGLAVSVAAQAPAADAARPKLISPVRGEAQVDVTRPASKRVGTNIVTTMRAKNRSSAPIAGLTVDEFWYDKDRQPVTGGKFRYTKPLMPGEVIDIEIKTPSHPAMSSNTYQFKHANGAVKTTNVARIEMPKKTT